MDYRPALRARTGVGEYVHQTARALAERYPQDTMTMFTSSWKDRPDGEVAADRPAVVMSDHRVPVSALNLSWHWLEWPSIEVVTRRRYDVAFSPHPLLLPAKHAAQVVMVHDLDFLHHPERTQREIRRDYPRLAGPHACRAKRVVVPSKHTAREVVEYLGVPRSRVVVCPPGAPAWHDPLPIRCPTSGYVLFVGTLDARKNVAGLLEGYGRLLVRRPTLPPLLLVGAAGGDAKPLLDAISSPPLGGHVEYLGYINDADRQRTYAGARVLVLPSFDEGFGMPVLEAMSLGVPVIAAGRGALPELVGDAGILINPDDPESITAALERVVTDDQFAEQISHRGWERSRLYRWQYTAQVLRAAFQEAIDESPARQTRCRT